MNFISNATDMVFSLEDGNFENCITETYNMITNPSRRLQSGMQGLNEMIGGGFESGRVYMFLGTSGIGKSKLLLNIMYQIKNYNFNYGIASFTNFCLKTITKRNIYQKK